MKSVMNIIDLNNALTKAIDFIIDLTCADRGSLILVDEEGNLHSEITRVKKGLQKAGTGGFQSFSRTFIKEVIETGKPIWVTDTQSDERFAYAMSVMAMDIRTVICVPLKDELKNIGVIYIDRLAIDTFTEEDLELTKSLAEYASMVLINAQLHLETKEKLQSAQDQLIQVEKLATIGTLVAGLAHEINNPIGAIMINVQMLIKTNNNEADKESLRIIEAAARRCQTIIKNLLTYSRISKSDELFKKINLNKIVNDILIFINLQAKKYNIEIKREFSEIPEINGIANQLQQVCTNLVLNGMDAIRKEKNSGTLTIRTYEEDSCIIMETIDDGCGIPAENINKLMDPFFTTKDVGEGTGLGLSICYGIIRKHEGSIEISTEVGKGSIFKVRLPKIGTIV